MQVINERRLFPRYPAISLQAEIGEQLFDVEDISLGGLRVSGIAEAEKGPVTFLLGYRHHGEFDRSRVVEVSGTVVGHYDNATALRFNRATMPLMKLVVRQAALDLGVEPYAVK